MAGKGAWPAPLLQLARLQTADAYGAGSPALLPRSASAERTIADLGCGHLDLLLVHWPHCPL